MSIPLDHFLKWERETPSHIFFQQPIDSQWHSYTFQRAGDEIRRIAAAIQAWSLPSESKIAILSKNCAHWIMADLAIWMSGNISVPLYPTLTAPSIQAILEHSGCSAIFLGKLDNFDSQRDGIPTSLQRISFPFYGLHEGGDWNNLIRDTAPLSLLEISPGSRLATLMYTSGTTGKPKGVMLSFDNIEFVLSEALLGFKLSYAREHFFSYLPLSHIAERNLVEMGALYSGSTIWFSESLEKFPANLMHAQPTVFLAVPRIWAKFQESILKKMPQQKLDRLLKIPIISGIIKKTIKKKLGLSRAKWILSGAAPLSVTLLEWFDRLGIRIHEVYGMTENQAFSHINLNEVRFGTVGRAWPRIDVRLSVEGEIQTKHAGVMLGYYQEPALTQEVFTADGFLRTGDIGSLDKDGFLSITGRIKDQFKTDKGKYISPSPIELTLSSNSLIEQVLVVGMGIPQPIVLVTLSAEGKSKTKQEIETSFAHLLMHTNTGLESYEKLEKVVILKEDWTVDNGLMTPSLKVKRNELERLYVPQYVTWFKEDGVVIWE